MMFCFSVFLWYFGEGCHLEAAKWEIGDRIQNYDTLNEEMIHHDWAGFTRPFNAVALSALVEAFVRWDCCDDSLQSCSVDPAGGKGANRGPRLAGSLNVGGLVLGSIAVDLCK